MQQQLLQLLPDRVSVTFDPGELYCALGLDNMLPILAAPLFLSTERELRMLTGKADFLAEPRPEILETGCRIVALKLGSRGSIVISRDEFVYAPARAILTVDTTGAGDVYAAGFVAGLLSEIAR